MALMAACVGCDSMSRLFGPDMPSGAVEYAADTAHATDFEGTRTEKTYAALWVEVETCIGKQAPMNRVRWFYYPGTRYLPDNSDNSVGLTRSHEIYFADIPPTYPTFPPWRALAASVRHEMAHEISGTRGHDPAIGKRCAGLLYIW